MSQQWRRRSRKRKDRMKLSLQLKLMVLWVSFIPPPLNANVLFLQVIFESHSLCMTKLRVLVLCFSYFKDNSIKLPVLNQLLARTNIIGIHPLTYVVCQSLSPYIRVFSKIETFLQAYGWGWRRHKSWWSGGSDKAAHVTQLVVVVVCTWWWWWWSPFI
jgi:hypothetical protein